MALLVHAGVFCAQFRASTDFALVLAEPPLPFISALSFPETLQDGPRRIIRCLPAGGTGRQGDRAPQQGSVQLQSKDRSSCSGQVEMTEDPVEEVMFGTSLLASCKLVF